MSDKPKKLGKTALGAALSIVGASGVSAWLALGDFRDVQSDTQTRALQIADAASNNTHDVQSDAGSSARPTQDSKAVAKPNRNIESYTPKQLANLAKKGDTEAADTLLDIFREVEGDFMNKLGEYGLTISEFRIMQRGRRLRFSLNMLQDENFDQYSLAWKQETSMNIGYDLEAARKSYQHKMLDDIVEVLTGIASSELRDENMLAMCEFDEHEMQQFVGDIAKYIETNSGNYLFAQSLREKFKPQ